MEMENLKKESGEEVVLKVRIIVMSHCVVIYGCVIKGNRGNGMLWIKREFLKVWVFGLFCWVFFVYLSVSFHFLNAGFYY